MDGHPGGHRLAGAARFLGALAVLAVGAAASSGVPADPFAFFSPTVRVTPAERTRLDTGDVLVRTLPADDGHLAVFAATRIETAPLALIEWTRNIERLKRGPLVLRVGRFARRPSPRDVEELSLESNDVDALRRCRPGNCEVKLSVEEIEAIRQAIVAAGADWRLAAQQAFRAALVERVRLHHERGLLALPSYADKTHSLSVGEAFSSIIARSPYLVRAFPDAVNTLQTPARDTDSDDAFYYWSQERYGGGRTVVTVTYVRLLPEPARAPQAMTVSTQLFASHYINGAVGLTAIVCDRVASCYLTYLNRTHSDMLGGLFGGLKRALIEERLESDTPAVLRIIKQRLESGPPDTTR
jgi:hypothetical protein